MEWPVIFGQACCASCSRTLLVLPQQMRACAAAVETVDKLRVRDGRASEVGIKWYVVFETREQQPSIV